ncbi:MAG: hydroxyethylthiazole kinase [Beijerinckiaceae bacterium]
MPSHPSHNELAAAAGSLLDRLRETRPLVQAVTNYVSMDVAANVLLAVGASPAMVHAPEEVEEFVSFSGALVVNIGTLSAPWVEGMEKAAAADRLGKPWTLDPVGVGATRFRNETTEKLLKHRPAIIRGNASEILAVARIAGVDVEAASPKGVDSAHETAAARGAAEALARTLSCTVAATGAVDLVTDGARTRLLANGSPVMAQVTALGCALSGVVAGFSALGEDRFETTAAAVAVYGVAGEMAQEVSKRPGSFRVAFLDALDAVNGEDIARRLKVA